MCTLSNIGELFKCLTGLISGPVIGIFFALAAAMFVWGVVNYFIIGAAEEKKRSEGKQFIIWGIIAFVVISSVWALVNILGSTFGLGPNTKFIPGITPSNKSFQKTPLPPPDATAPPHGSPTDKGGASDEDDT